MSNKEKEMEIETHPWFFDRVGSHLRVAISGRIDCDTELLQKVKYNTVELYDYFPQDKAASTALIENAHRFIDAVLLPRMNEASS